MLYICSHCDSQYPKWQGQCDECGKWGTVFQSSSAQSLSRAEVSDASSSAEVARFSFGLPEAENVLGGGLVSGSLVLLCGDPGIGKSTLVLQMVGGFVRENIADAMYVCAEESPEQISMRLCRLKIKPDRVKFVSQPSLGQIIGAIKSIKPSLVVIDSIQTVSDENIASEQGSPSQIRSSCAQLLKVAKQANIPIIIVGHITKEGSFAGPQTLAHMVDAVLYLEGDRLRQYRLLRCTKNRFGPTNQVGVFSMSDKGLEEVKNPSQMFLEGAETSNPGSVVSVIMEGARPFLIEIQALTNKTSYGYPKRAASGFDLSRMELLIAVLQRRAGLKLDNQDVFLNVVGGLRVKDPALDLAACIAIASSLSNQPMPKKSVVLGELGLGGEVRLISHIEERVREARRLGFDRIYAPAGQNKVSDIKSALALIGIEKK